MSGNNSRHPPGIARKMLYGAIMTLLALVWLEGLLNLLWLAPDYRYYRNQYPPVLEFKEESYSRYDENLGWDHIQGTHIADFYGNGLGVTINDDGFRGLENYLPEKPPDRYRLVALGDSFTFGYGVGDGHSYAAVLEAINQRLQTVNMGQCGYSVGQCYLWYRQHAATLDADMLVFAVITDDIWRMAGKRTANGYGQPVFRLDNETVRVENQPVPQKLETGTLRFGRRQAMDFFLQQNAVLRTLDGILPRRLLGFDAQDENELMAIALAMIGDLGDDSRKADRAFAVVLLPELAELTDADSSSIYEKVALVIGTYCHERNIPFLNMRSHFKTQGPLARRFFLDEEWHHYSPTGHRFVANRLDAWLRDVVPGYPR